jgi:hypothetical protein
MSQDSLTTKLAKANGNVKRLCEFLTVRREWVFPPEAGASRSELKAAASGVGDQLRRLMEGCGAESVQPPSPPGASVGPGTHDNARLQRFTVFLRDLETWFAAQTDAPTDADGIEALREMDAHIICLLDVFDPEPGSSGVPRESDDAPPESPPTGPSDPGATERPGASADHGGAPRRLVLDDTEENPLVQEFRGITELTPLCEKLADDFLDAWKIELSYYNRKKFLERLLRWISSAPEGQVLVIKMKTLEEPYEPYPSYVSRDVLEGKEPPQAE